MILLSLTCAGALVGCGNNGGSNSEVENNSTRTVSTERGQVDVPSDPQRIVAVDWQIPPTLVDLGVTPVGIYEGYYEPDKASARSVPQHYIDTLAGATRIGNWDSLNLETISTLDPDLIVSTGVGLDDSQLDQLSKIAPLALASNSGDLESQRQIADIVNRQEEFDALHREFTNKAAGIADRHHNILSETTFVSISGGQDANWYAEGGQTAVGTLLNAVGAKFSRVVDPTGWWGQPRSLESLGELSDATVILYTSGPDGKPAHRKRACRCGLKPPASSSDLAM